MIGKLNEDLTRTEEMHFENWVEASHMNESFFSRLQTLKNKGANFEEFETLNIELALTKVRLQLSKKH